MTKNVLLGRVGAVFALVTVAVVAACGDDDANEGGGGPDSGAVALPDGGGTDANAPPSDSGAADVGDTGSSEASTDAGATIQTTVGSTGYIRLFNDAVFASFYEDDTILRASNAPECVVHFRSPTKPRSQAGSITIGGPVVGVDGGPAQPLIGTPDPIAENEYLVFDPAVFPSNDDLQVTVEGAGSDAFPAMPAQALRPPPATLVKLTAPAHDGGPLSVSSTQPLQLTWTPPASAKAGATMVVAFTEIKVPPSGKTASLFCNYPLAAGSAKVPPNLLAALKAVVGAGAAGTLSVFAGGGKEFTANGASYVLAASRFDARDIELASTPLQ